MQVDPVDDPIDAKPAFEFAELTAELLAEAVKSDPGFGAKAATLELVDEPLAIVLCDAETRLMLEQGKIPAEAVQPCGGYLWSNENTDQIAAVFYEVFL